MDGCMKDRRNPVLKESVSEKMVSDTVGLEGEFGKQGRKTL